VAAPKKITPEMEAEILRRRAAGEGIRSIANDFDIAHQTVSKLDKRAAQNRAAELERQRQTEIGQRRQAPQLPALTTDKQSTSTTSGVAAKHPPNAAPARQTLHSPSDSTDELGRSTGSMPVGAYLATT